MTHRRPIWPALAVLLFAYVFSIFFRGFLTVIALDLERELGIGPGDLGALGAAWFIVFAVAQFPVGYALDRLGPRLTVSACMVAGVAGVALLGAANGFAMAALGMGLMGLGCAPVFMGSLFILAKALPPERFGPATSVFIGLGSAGNLLGGTPMALAVEAFGWRGTLYAIAAAFALATLLVALVVRDPPRGSAGADADEGLWQGLRTVLAIGPLWILMPLVLVGYAVLVTERGLWIGPFFGQVHGYDRLAQGHAAFLMAVAMTAGALAFGPFERIMRGPKPAVALSTGIVALAFAALAWRGTSSPLEALLWLCLIGGAGFSYGSLMGHARLFMPDRLIGRGMTFVNFGFIAGSAAVQLGSGLFMQAARDAGAAPDQAFARLHLGFAVLLLAALALYLAAPARARDD